MDDADCREGKIRGKISSKIYLRTQKVKKSTKLIKLFDDYVNNVKFI